MLRFLALLAALISVNNAGLLVNRNSLLAQLEPLQQRDIGLNYVSDRIASMSQLELQRQKFLLDILQRVQQPLADEQLLSLAGYLVKDAEYYDGGIDQEMQYIIDLAAGGRLLSKKDIYSIANAADVRQLLGIYRLLVRARDFDTFQRNACYLRQQVNGVLFVEALLLAIRDRQDTERLIVPAIYEILPELYYDEALISKARQLDLQQLSISDSATRRPSLFDLIGMGRRSRILGHQLPAIDPMQRAQLWMPWRELRMNAAMQQMSGNQLQVAVKNENRLVLPVARSTSGMDLLTQDIGFKAFVQGLINQVTLRQEETLAEAIATAEESESFDAQDAGQDADFLLSADQRNDGDTFERHSVKEQQQQQMDSDRQTDFDIEKLPRTSINNDRLLFVNRRRYGDYSFGASGLKASRPLDASGIAEGRRTKESRYKSKRFNAQRQSGSDEETHFYQASQGLYKQRGDYLQPERKDYDQLERKGYRQPESSLKDSENYEKFGRKYYEQDEREYYRQPERLSSHDGFEQYQETIKEREDYHPSGRINSGYDSYSQQDYDYRQGTDFIESRDDIREATTPRLPTADIDSDRLLHVSRRRVSDLRNNEADRFLDLVQKETEPISEGRHVQDDQRKQGKRFVADDDNDVDGIRRRFNDKRTGPQERQMSSSKLPSRSSGEERLLYVNRRRMEPRMEQQQHLAEEEYAGNDYIQRSFLGRDNEGNAYSGRRNGGGFVIREAQSQQLQQPEQPIQPEQPQQPILFQENEDRKGTARKQSQREQSHYRGSKYYADDDEGDDVAQRRIKYETTSSIDDINRLRDIERDAERQKMVEQREKDRKQRQREQSPYRGSKYYAENDGDDYENDAQRRVKYETTTSTDDINRLRDIERDAERQKMVEQREKYRKQRQREQSPYRGSKYYADNDDDDNENAAQRRVKYDTSRFPTEMNRLREHERAEEDRQMRDRRQKERQERVYDYSSRRKFVKDEKIVNDNDDDNVDDDSDAANRLLFVGRRSRRLARSLSTTVYNDDRDFLQQFRSAELLIHNLQQLMARINMERSSLASAGGIQFRSRSNDLPQDERYALRLNEMRLNGLGNRLMLECCNKLLTQLKALLQQQLQQSPRDNINFERSIADVLFGRRGSASILDIFQDFLQQLQRNANKQSLKDIGVLFTEPVLQLTFNRVFSLIEEQREQLLGSYQRAELEETDISIDSVSVGSLRTFVDAFDSDLLNLLDGHADTFQLKRSEQQQQQKLVVARQQRLNNKPFSIDYAINANKAGRYILRTFLGPKSIAVDGILPLNEARLDFMLLDAAIVDLKLGRNVITRKSRDISYTARDTTTYTEIYESVMTALGRQQPSTLPVGFAGIGGDIIGQSCRFPQRLLLPRGRADGLPMQLFTIVSRLDDADLLMQELQVSDESLCGIGISSIKLDRRSLGYPLDRRIDNTEQFLNLPNVKLSEILIYHEEK